MPACERAERSWYVTRKVWGTTNSAAYGRLLADLGFKGAGFHDFTQDVAGWSMQNRMAVAEACIWTEDPAFKRLAPELTLAAYNMAGLVNDEDAPLGCMELGSIDDGCLFVFFGWVRR